MSKILSATIASLLTAQAAFAANGTWTSTTAGLWSDPSRWSGSIVADGIDFLADFNSVNTPSAGITVSLDSARTIGNLTFGDTDGTTAASPGGWVLNNNAVAANILTLQTTAGTPTITVNTLGTNASAVTARATISAVLSGNQGFIKAGTGGLVLSAANTLSGTVTLNAGYLALSNASALGTASLTITAGSLDSTVAGITLDAHTEAWNGNFTYTGTQSLNTGTGAVTFNANRTVTVTANTLTVGGSVTATTPSFTFTKSGSGTLVLNGVNTWTGATSITGGVLRFGTVAGSVPNSTITIGANGTLAGAGPTAATQSPGFDSVSAWLASGKIVTTSTGAIAITAATDSSSIDFTGYNGLYLGAVASNTYNGTLTQAGGYRLGGGGTLTVSSQLNAAQGLTVAPTGILILSAANGYTGITSLVGGSVLRVANNSALGTTNGTAGTGTTVASGGRLELDGGVTVSNELITINGTGGNNLGALSNNSGNNTWAGNVVLGADLTRIGVTAGTLNVTGVIDDGVNDYQLIIRNNSGTTGAVRLSNVNTYGGNTQVIVGVLQLGVNGALPQTSIVMGNASGQGTSATLDLNGFAQTVTGVAPISGNNITTRVANSSATAGALTLNVTSNQTTGTGTGGLIFGNTAQNNFSLTKSGTATYTIGTVSTYTGATNITGGTLALGSVGSIASSAAVNVAAGATLDASAVATGYTVGAGKTLVNNGTVTGTVIVSGSLSGAGTISGPVSGSATGVIGAGPDSQTTGSLSLQSGLTTLGATIELKLAPSQAQTSDRLTIAGNLDLSSIDKLNLIALESFSTTTTFQLATLGSTTSIFDTILINGAASQSTNALAANYALISYNGTSITIDVANVAAIPEPSALMALTGGLGMLLGVCRMRRFRR